MSHENISHPDKARLYVDLDLEIARLTCEVKFWRGVVQGLRGDISAIADRAASGEDVYIEMPDGERIHLVKRPAKPQQVGGL